MRPFIRTLSILCSGWIIAGGAAAQEASSVNNDNTLTPFAFAEQVRGAGGQVAFVFGAARPFAQCHASTVVEVSPGVLLAAWFGGTREKDPDVSIWYSRFENKKWSKPEVLAKVNDTAHWNPVLFRDKEGAIYIFFKVSPEIPPWQTYWKRSDDGGKTWTEAVELVPGDHGGRGPVRNKPIILSDGTWVAGASTELGAWKPFADLSTDRGKTWTRTDDFAIDSAVLTGKGAIQPTLWETEPGKVHALLRSTGGSIWRTDSEDGGKTWAPVRAISLPNNNSGIDALYLPEDKRVLLVYNPVAQNWGGRSPLDLAESHDNGETWTPIAHLEHDADTRSEFSYPAIVRTTDGIAITYTYQRERIRCWQIPLTAIP